MGTCLNKKGGLVARSSLRKGAGLCACLLILALSLSHAVCEEGAAAASNAVPAAAMEGAAPNDVQNGLSEGARRIPDEGGREKKADVKPPTASTLGGAAGQGEIDFALVGGIIVAVLVGCAGAYFLLCSGEGKKRFKGDAVFLLGPCGAGKTAIFFKLLNENPKASLRPTHTSMIPNEASMPIEGVDKPVRVIDFPGHLRLRPKLFSVLEDCRAVIFVLDSSTFVKQAKEAAEMILDLMCSPALLKHADRMLVVCNKTDTMPDDLAGIQPKNLVRKRLETEIEMLRVSRASGLGEIGDVSERMQLEIEGSAFRWSDSPIAAEFIDYSAKTEGVSPLANFINSL